MDDRKSWRSSVGILPPSEYSWRRENIPPTAPSAAVVSAGGVAFVATLFFIMSFSSPYWLQSYQYTYSEFTNMGIWEVCFTSFRHPKNQFDHKFIGCNYMFSNEYRIIREWILPAWLMGVQAFMVIALIASFSTLIALTFVLIRWPLQLIMRHEWHIIAFCTICQIITVVSIFFAVFVFGIMCWSREWLLYPNFNYLSWSYGFAVISGAIHLFAGFLMLNETYASRDRKREVTGTQMDQMEPQGHIGPAVAYSTSQQSYSQQSYY